MKQLNTMLAAGILLAACSGVALGQDAGGDFKRPLRSTSKPKAAQGSSSNSRSTTVMRQDSGDDTIELRIEDGKTTAKINGEQVPEDRIVRDGDEVKILDKDGKTLSTFHMSVGDGRTIIMGQPPAPPAAPRALKAPKAPRAAAAPMANPPKVMLGITMDAPSESLLKNYDLKEGQAIVVQKVVEGLPADKAGLKENDIITEIDGKKPVTQEIVRDVLRGKEPGDTVELTVLRKGGDKSIRITLDKYDPEKLSSLMTPSPDDGAMVWDLKGNGDNDPSAFADKALREALKNRGNWQSFTVPGGGGQGFVMGHGADMDKKLAELDDKMAELDDKLQRVNDQIAKLQALIEKLSEQRGR